MTTRKKSLGKTRQQHRRQRMQQVGRAVKQAARFVRPIIPVVTALLGVKGRALIALGAASGVLDAILYNEDKSGNKERRNEDPIHPRGGNGHGHGQALVPHEDQYVVYEVEGEVEGEAEGEDQAQAN